MQIKILKNISPPDFFTLDLFSDMCYLIYMKDTNLHDALNINGEDVVIDYKNEDVIFPNRPEESEKLRFERIAAISHYLKEEGFLDTLPSTPVSLPNETECD